MKKSSFAILCLLTFCGSGAVVSVPFTAADSSGVVSFTGDGSQEFGREKSEAFIVRPNGVYGLSYEASYLATRGLMTVGTDDVNVDRTAPDANWYTYEQVYRVGLADGDSKLQRFHVGHYRGNGTFSFKGLQFRPLRPVYRQEGALALGYGESLLQNRYRFGSAFASLARNESRPLKHFRGAGFNSTRWNVHAGSEIVYRHELGGRTFQNGAVTVQCGYYVGQEPMALEVSVDDGATWREFAQVTNRGMVNVAIPAELFPARTVEVRFRGLAKTNLQIGRYAFEGDVDGENMVLYGETSFQDPVTGQVFGTMASPLCAAKLTEDQARLIVAEGGVSLWQAVADVKVFRETPPPEAQTDALRVALAANERESVQLVVTPAESALKELRATVGDLVSETGSRLSARHVQIARLGYVYVKVPTDETGTAGWWPDPILPQDAEPLAVPKKFNQPLWITVSVPKGTPSGFYRGDVKVTAGALAFTVPLEVEVYGFQLPDRLTCETAYGFSPARVAQFHRVKPGSFEHDQILEKYIQLFSDYRLTVYHWGKGERPKLTWTKSKDPAKAQPKLDTLEFDDAVTEMRGRFNFTTLRAQIEGLGHGFQDGFAPGRICGVDETNACYQPLMGRYLGALESHLKERGWLKSAYVYWFDEPQEKVFPQVAKGMATLKRHAPGLRRMLTTTPTRKLWDGVNLWNPLLNHFNCPEQTAARQRGDQFWWYICCGPRAPYPTEFIDHAGGELRTWLWMTWAAGVKGTLIWETSLWTSRSVYPDRRHPQNPYEDPMAWNTTGGVWGNGDGRFVYPPVKTVTTPYEKGQPPIFDAPNPSYRLAILRDGLEDYEYFAQLAKKDPAHPLLKVPETVFRKFNDFNVDPTPMRRHREKLAREIARLGGGEKFAPPAPTVPAWHDGQASSYREADWRKIRHERKMAEIKAHGGKPYDLVLLGDSITELWEWQAPRWGSNEFVRLNQKLDTLALGYGGDGIQHVLGRIARGELDGYTAKCVAIMIGTNNKGCKPEEMAAGLEGLIADIRLKQPKAKIVVYATFPCRQTWRNLRNRAANRLYADVCRRHRLVFRDINDRLTPDLFPDGLHPNEKGYAIWRADLEEVCASAE